MWFKITTLIIIFLYINMYKNKELYYYKNLGTSKKQLWIQSISFDFVLFIILIVLALKLKSHLLIPAL